MKQPKIPKAGWIENIDTANEEIARLNAKHGNAKREFVENIDTANELIAELEAKPVTAIATPKVPASVATPKESVTAELPKVAAPVLTGLRHAIAANSKSKPTPPAVPDSQCMGLQRAINANILKSKSQKS